MGKALFFNVNKIALNVFHKGFNPIFKMILLIVNIKNQG